MEERELLTGEFLVWHFYTENCQASQANQVRGDDSAQGQCCDDVELCLGWGMAQKVVAHYNTTHTDCYIYNQR